MVGSMTIPSSAVHSIEQVYRDKIYKRRGQKETRRGVEHKKGGGPKKGPLNEL